MKIVVTAAVAASLLLASTASAASPEKEAAGWAKWADFGEGLIAAHERGTISGMKDACTGVTRMMISQGFQFPYWAQQQMMFCTGMGYIAADNRKAACKTLKPVSKELAKAKPVAAEARAEPIARRLKEITDGALEVNGC